jgi:heme-degrading monooxygenase HmoA
MHTSVVTGVVKFNTSSGNVLFKVQKQEQRQKTRIFIVSMWYSSRSGSNEWFTTRNDDERFPESNGRGATTSFSYHSYLHLTAVGSYKI